MSNVQIGAMIQQTPEAPPAEFREYPVVLVHPHARKAETVGVPGTEKRDSLGRLIPGVFDQYRGTADFMPPVTVNNSEQEAMHRAQGYVRGGTSSIEAFSKMTARGSGAPVGPPIEYPKWVDGVLVEDAIQEAALKRMGMDAPRPEPADTWKPYIVSSPPADTVPKAEFDALKAQMEELLTVFKAGQVSAAFDAARKPGMTAKEVGVEAFLTAVGERIAKNMDFQPPRADVLFPRPVPVAEATVSVLVGGDEQAPEPSSPLPGNGPRQRHVRTPPPERTSGLGKGKGPKERTPAQIAAAAKLGAAAKARAEAKRAGA